MDNAGVRGKYTQSIVVLQNASSIYFGSYVFRNSPFSWIGTLVHWYTYIGSKLSVRPCQGKYLNGPFLAERHDSAMDILEGQVESIF